MAARIATEQVIDMRYRARMMGVPVIPSTILIGDNKLIQTSGSLPSSPLSKKHLAIAYHKIREAVAASIMTFVWIGTLLNIADLLTKPLNGMRHRSLTKAFMFCKGGWLEKGSINSEADEDSG